MKACVGFVAPCGIPFRMGPAPRREHAQSQLLSSERSLQVSRAEKQRGDSLVTSGQCRLGKIVIGIRLDHSPTKFDCLPLVLECLSGSPLLRES